MYLLRYWLLLLLTTLLFTAHAQQDMDLHLSDTFLAGKNIIKVKRDFADPYLWVLAQNNEVYRINSITKVVDNYTTKFSAYSALPFIDIAGDDKEAVFIATNSNVIKYKNGIVTTIGTADGLPNQISSIGFDFKQTEILWGLPPNIEYDQLVIGTSTGVFRYDLKIATILKPNLITPNSRIFESSYRVETYSANAIGQTWPDDVTYYPLNSTGGDGNIYNGYIWLGGKYFGNNLKSTYVINDNYFEILEFEPLACLLWSTENGLFLNWYRFSYASMFGYKQYLNGIGVNKISSIYGLVNFPKVTRENILAGSDQGLYFATSSFQLTLDELYFTHFDELGNKVIHDICTNATSYIYPATKCEDGVWVAAADGLYLLKPDYSKYIDKTKQLDAIQFDGQDRNTDHLEICVNSSVNAVSYNSNYQNYIQQWYKDGLEITNESKPTLNIKTAGDYYLAIYDPCSGYRFNSNHLKVTQVAAPVFTFNYPDVVNYCAGTSAQLKTDAKPNYQYRWYKDGVLNGNTTATQDNITETGKYKVEVSACEGNWITSKEVQINFISIPTPVLTTDKTSYCDGDLAVLSASVPIDGSKIINWSGYQYSWFKDGNSIIGSVSSIKVGQAGKYKVVVSGCSGSVSSAELQVDFLRLDKPIITADKAAYCIGDNAQLNTNISFDPFTTTITWFKDGAMLANAQNQTSLTTNQSGTYLVNLFDNTKQCQISSASYNLTFTPPPTVSIQQFVNSSLCSGETVDLKASYTSGTIKWSTGETADNISVKSSGTYTATITTPAGCSVETTSTVQFLPIPILNVPDATLCQYTKESITLTAPAGFVKYEWNGQAGSSSFTTDKLGQVSLTVTDNNGCRATQTIVISSHCDDIHVPNAFSPNGDGHNDTWVIAGLEGDLSTTVKVYNRLGSQIFLSQGYATPWNGSYNGKKLPAGVYYYVISAKGAKQVLSGSVTIIY